MNAPHKDAMGEAVWRAMALARRTGAHPDLIALLAAMAAMQEKAAFRLRLIRNLCEHEHPTQIVREWAEAIETGTPPPEAA